MKTAVISTLKHTAVRTDGEVDASDVELLALSHTLVRARVLQLNLDQLQGGRTARVA